MSIEGVDATETALLAAMLSSDNVPDENQDIKCFSCDAPMKGLFCSECGQKNDNYRRSIFSLVADLVTSVFSLESRIWRTWATLLFKPGKVPREFSDGRRSQWSSPIRVYLAMSIILFGFMTVTNTHLVSIDVDPKIKDGVEKPYEDLEKSDIETKWKAHFFETQKSIDARNATRDLHLLEIWLSESQVNLTPEQRAELNAELETAIEEFSNAGAVFGQENNEPVLDAAKDEAVSTAEEVLDSISTGVTVDEEDGMTFTVGGRRLTNEEGTRIFVNFVKNPKLVTQSFNKWLPRLMFFMMPFTMLLGAVFIRDKKKALLFDHLVHATYIHAFAFFLLFAGIMASKLATGVKVFQIIFVALLIYLPLSLKRMFGRGWFKTFLTSYGVGFMYLIFLILALAGLMSYEIATTLELANERAA